MGLDSLLKGKEKTYAADPLAGDVNATGKAGLTYMRSGGKSLNDIFSQDPTRVVNNRIAQENRMLNSVANDTNKRAEQLIAQRGMGSSSIGLGQVLGQRKNLSLGMVMNNAGAEGRIRDMMIQNGEGLIGAGQSLWQPKASQGPMQMTDVKKRSGGLAGLLGAGVGAYFGGAQGAQTGMAMGDAYAYS